MTTVETSANKRLFDYQSGKGAQFGLNLPSIDNELMVSFTPFHMSETVSVKARFTTVSGALVGG